MERVCEEGKGKRRMRCEKKDEKKEQGKYEGKEKQKMEKAIHERHHPLQTLSLARS